MRDTVRYALPFGPLGLAAHALFVRRDLRADLRLPDGRGQAPPRLKRPCGERRHAQRVACRRPCPRSRACLSRRRPSRPRPCGCCSSRTTTGDALLVEDLLRGIRRARRLRPSSTLAEAVAAAAGPTARCWTSGCPTPRASRRLRALRGAADDLAIVVLTGLADEGRGIEAVAAGAQDYLVKGERRRRRCWPAPIRYAVERRRADDAAAPAAPVAQLPAAENARLERGLLPTPLVRDPRLRSAPRYRAGPRARAARRRLLRRRRGPTDGTLHVHDRRRLRPRPRRGGARRLPADRLADAGARRRAGGRRCCRPASACCAHERHAERGLRHGGVRRRSRPTAARSRCCTSPGTRRRSCSAATAGAARPRARPGRPSASSTERAGPPSAVDAAGAAGGCCSTPTGSIEGRSAAASGSAWTACSRMLRRGARRHGRGRTHWSTRCSTPSSGSTAATSRDDVALVLVRLTAP